MTDGPIPGFNPYTLMVLTEESTMAASGHDSGDKLPEFEHYLRPFQCLSAWWKGNTDPSSGINDRREILIDIARVIWNRLEQELSADEMGHLCDTSDGWDMDIVPLLLLSCFDCIAPGAAIEPSIELLEIRIDALVDQCRFEIEREVTR